MSGLPDWRLAAVRIGRSTDRRLGLLVGGESVDARVELAYYLWCVRDDDGEVMVVDAGFTEAAAARRTIVDHVAPAAALDRLGIDAAAVRTVALTHLHWDHMGGFADFPRARFLVGRAEWAWTMSRVRGGGRMFDETYDAAALGAFAELPPDRVELVDSVRGWRRGCSLEVVGGHTPGHLVVRVALAERTAVLLGDLAYLYANLEHDAAPMICHDRWRTRDLYHAYPSDADRPVRPLPGHDPAVLERMDHRPTNDIALCE